MDVSDSRTLALAGRLATYLIAERFGLRARKGRECPICHKDDWCVFNEHAALCRRAKNGVKRFGEYGFLIILDDTLTHDYRPLKSSTKKHCRLTDSELDVKFRPRAEHAWQNKKAMVVRLARDLGVAAWALDDLRVGYLFGPPAYWTFPELSPSGHVVGINRRFADGAKRCMKGSRRGLTFCKDWHDYHGPIHIVEGGSDVAAGLTLGICVVGRPSNTGGVSYLTELLKPFRSRKIIVMGERDKKDTGQYPGMDGLIHVGRSLSNGLRRSVDTHMPPDEAKDLRVWLNAQDVDIEDPAAVVALGGKVFR